MKPLLAQSHPHLAAEWADPDKGFDDVTSGSGYKALWTCSEGHEWHATVYSRANAKPTGCPFCSGRSVLIGFNDLASQFPDIATQWDDSQKLATEVVSGSGYIAQWKCVLGHTWRAPVYKRAVSGQGCPTCAGRRVIPGFNDFASAYPTLAAEWDEASVQPEEVTSGSNRLVQWKCTAGHVWVMSPNTRVQQHQGCPTCQGRQVLPGFNDLAFQFPELAAEWDDKSRGPETVTSKSGYSAFWKCNRGHRWQARVVDRHRFGCPDCNASNFVSGFETEVAVFIKARLPDAELKTTFRGFRKDGIAELDVYIPDLNFAIECNGVYWHSEAGGKAPGYHQEKREACERLGIRLVQVWQDDWADRRDIVEQMLAHKLGFSNTQRIAARRTTASFISKSDAEGFMEQNHIQGFTNGSYYLGLRADNDELVAAMVLKKTDASGKKLRLERYATGAHVIGGQSKLIRYAEREIPNWESLVTFADLEVSDGGLYEATGWVEDARLAPDYKYLVRSKRVHKFNYRLKRFRDDPTLKYEEGLSERELALLNNLPRIWDSGKIRYRYTRRPVLASPALSG